VGLLARGVELLLADPADVRHVSGLGAEGVGALVVVGLVQAEVLEDLFRVGTLNDDRVDRLLEQLVVVDVRAGDHDPSGPPCCSTSTCFLVAIFALSVGFGPRLAPSKRLLPMTPSAACHSQRTPSSSSHSVSRYAQISSSRPSAAKR
jgi:hypothetical protein